MDGKLFGAEEYGPYELIRGTIYFSFDPSNGMNQNITDLSLAPRNKDGRVEASSDLVVLKPVKDGKSARTALVEVSNRGSKFIPSYFNQATSSRMKANNENWFGDALVMRKGLTVIWVGWQFDVPDKAGNLTANIPVARQPNGEPIKGLVRSDWVVDQPINTLKLGHRNLNGYPVTDTASAKNTLTVRDGRNAPRKEIPRNNLEYAEISKNDTLFSDSHIILQDGFTPGKIYELVYQSANPPVVGLGMGIIRDVISYAKYNPTSLFPVDKGLAAGVSQTGRFLRHFIYQGFNIDEQYRKAYDGLMIMTAGAGRGSFNHRFAQPSRDAHRYSAFFYPTDIFPFTGSTQFDEKLWESDGLFAYMPDSTFYPKTFYVNIGYEYWGRAASLIHTTPDGSEDIAPMPNERIYHIASGQHFVDNFPPSKENRVSGTPAFKGNPLNFKVNYRALLVNLVEWVADSTRPPESRFPRNANGSLINHSNLNLPDIPGITPPEVIHTAHRVDYGPQWQDGIINKQPPKVGEPFTSKVSQLDEKGNEKAGIRNVEIRVPLATYLPWSKRYDKPANTGEIDDFRGLFVPLPLTERSAQMKNDGRPSVQELYQSKDDYMNEVKRAIRVLQYEKFLLEEDVDMVRQRAEELWIWIHNNYN